MNVGRAGQICTPTPSPSLCFRMSLQGPLFSGRGLCRTSSKITRRSESALPRLVLPKKVCVCARLCVCLCMCLCICTCLCEYECVHTQLCLTVYDDYFDLQMKAPHKGIYPESPPGGHQDDPMGLPFPFLAQPCSLEDLSSLTRDRTQALCGGRAESSPLDGQPSPTMGFSLHSSVSTTPLNPCNPQSDREQSPGPASALALASMTLLLSLHSWPGHHSWSQPPRKNQWGAGRGQGPGRSSQTLLFCTKNKSAHLSLTSFLGPGRLACEWPAAIFGSRLLHVKP